MSDDIYRDNVILSDKKKFLNELWTKNLGFSSVLKGTTLDEKISNIIIYFNEVERDEKVSISIDGYEKLLKDLHTALPKFNSQLKSEFELQEEIVMDSSLLLDYNIRPRDVLELLTKEDLDKFHQAQDISTRGNNIVNILGSYKDSENLFLENYSNIGYRDLHSLKENSLPISESELGSKFEELTKEIFSQLGFNVDEELRKNSTQAKIK